MGHGNQLTPGIDQMLRPIADVPRSRTSSTTPSATVLTETGLRDEVPGHGEYVLLARLVVADGEILVHLGRGGCVPRDTTFTLARYPSLFRRTAEDIASPPRRRERGKRARETDDRDGGRRRGRK